MSLQIKAIIVVDVTNPVEAQAWLDEHAELDIQRFFILNNIFYFLY